MWQRLAIVTLWLVPAVPAGALDRTVSTSDQFRNALSAAEPGDRILLRPGIYVGGHYRSGLTDVDILAADPRDPPVIRGGANAIQLSDAHRVTIEHLVFEQQTGNGVNIDDGGSFDSPSTQITLRQLVVRDIVGAGNRDGIKLSGVTGFVIDQVQVLDWGDGGSAVDMVGSHHGIIQNSVFRHGSISDLGSGLRPKGGSKGITIRANRIELPNGKGRAIQAGGSTGSEYFRFIDGDAAYEASSIVAEGNVIVGSSSPFSYVNIDGGVFHHNYSERPFDWVVRILNENPGSAIVDTQNGRFTDNVIRYRDTATEFKTAVNAGAETLPRTFVFARNQWYNEANPARSRPDLPVVEDAAIVGVEPTVDADAVIPWQFEWGTWLVNTSRNARVHVVESGAYQRVEPGADAAFQPLDVQPFLGDWTYEEVADGQVALAPFSQAYLVRRAAPGDFNRNGMLDADDMDRLSSEVRGGTATSWFDLNGDARVTALDREFWVGQLCRTYFGDATLDGQFNSADLVAVFQAGRYESAAAAGWATGDWDGDSYFTSADLVRAYQDGGYEQGPRADAVAVPEPGAAATVIASLAVVAVCCRRRTRWD